MREVGIGLDSYQMLFVGFSRFVVRVIVVTIIFFVVP